MQGKEDFETGKLVLVSPSQWQLAVGLLLLHLKFQTEPLISTEHYEQCCNVVLQTKGSSALCSALSAIIENNLKPQRKRALREFLKYLWLLQSHKATNGLDSIALATRFGNFIIRPPSGTEPLLSRVKLMGALAILIENVNRSLPAAPPSSKAPTVGPSVNLPSGAMPRGSTGHTPDVLSPGALSPAVETRSSPSPSVGGNAVPPSAIPTHVQTRPKPSLSIGMQTVDVARSAVIVIDSAQKTLLKFQTSLDEITDKEKMMELLKKLNYIEGLLEDGTSSGGSSESLIY